MAEADSRDTLVQFHADLKRKYALHGDRVRELWRSFDKGQRTRAIKAGSADGVVLKHARDPSLGNVCHIMPEWNLLDLTRPGSDFLLDMLEHRATKSLHEQYYSGFNGGPGDGTRILESMRTYGLRNAESFKNCFTMFVTEEDYGRSYRTLDAATYKSAMAEFAVAVNAGACVPQSTGELIITRQTYFMTLLTTVINDILDIGATSRIKAKRPEKDDRPAQDAMSKLAITKKPRVLSIRDLIETANDYKSGADDYLALLSAEPLVLAHELNWWFFTQPELIKDDKGRAFPAVSDKYLSPAFFDMIQNNVIGAANWNYIFSLLQLLEQSTGEKGLKTALLQNLSNACHAEFVRAQKIFKRIVQSQSGAKYFQRVADVYDNGAARVNLKGKPDSLLRENAQLSYMLQLCHPGTNAVKAVTWLKMLDDLHTSHPGERENMTERELSALGDLAMIVSFVQSLSASFSLPPINQSKGQIFAVRSKALAAELAPLRSRLDLSEYVIPIDNLLEPGKADEAVDAFNRLVKSETGTQMGFLYQDLIEACLEEIQTQNRQQKEAVQRGGGIKSPETVSSPFGSSTEPDRSLVIERRRDKEKTRSTHDPSVFDVAEKPSAFSTPSVTSPAEATQVFTVKPTTLSVFSALFSTQSKTQSLGSVSWSAFEAAMADLGFSVVPKFGSVITFEPPLNGHVPKSVTLHRPHGSRIEGYRLRIVARRLRNVYGWGDESFRVA